LKLSTPGFITNSLLYQITGRYSQGEGSGDSIRPAQQATGGGNVGHGHIGPTTLCRWYRCWYKTEVCDNHGHCKEKSVFGWCCCDCDVIDW
jgi:hypothetical protein